MRVLGRCHARHATYTGREHVRRASHGNGDRSGPGDRPGRRIGDAAGRRARRARGRRVGRRDGDRGQRRRPRRRRRQRGLRPSGHDARLPARGSRPLPRDGDDRRLRGSPAAGPDRPVDLGVGRAEQDQRLPGRLRLLRADPHPRRHARGGLRDPGRPHAPEGAATLVGPTHRLWEVKFGSHPVAATKGGSAGRGRLADVVDARGGPGRPDGGHPRGRRDPGLHLGGRLARAGLVQARLGHRRQDARPAGQREQRPRPDLGGARRHDHAARRLPRPVLPGGLPRGGLDPAVLEARQGAVGRLGRRLRRAPSSTRSGSTRSRTRTTARPPAGCTTSSG